MNKLNSMILYPEDVVVGTGTFNINRENDDWSGELKRCLSIGRSSYDISVTAAYTPGALQGVWEGVFTVGLFFTVH